GTFNVLHEFIEYDRSIVLDALGETAAARASYRRYLQLVGVSNRSTPAAPGGAYPTSPKRPLEPYFLKRVDRYIRENLGRPFTIAQVAQQSGVSARTLQKAFEEYRGTTPVAHARNLRLDHARQALEAGEASVAEIATRYGFGSSTTFALEYRKRF